MGESDGGEGRHSMHAVLHRWYDHLSESKEAEALGWHAVRLVAGMVRSESERQH